LKKIIMKGIVGAIIIVIIHMLINSFATPMNNSVALLQLEDSNSALAVYDAWQAYGPLLSLALSFLVIVLLFYKDVKKSFGGNADETK
jgi:H+/Cl- antiporter ClcA